MSERKKRKKEHKAKRCQPTLEDLKVAYNKRLEEHRRVVEIIDDLTIPLSEREEYIPQFKMIGYDLSNLIHEIKKLGYEMDKCEILNGFDEPSLMNGTKPAGRYLTALALPNDFELSDEFREGKDKVEGGENHFVTGDAGSGKTTFLTYLKQNTSRNLVILAPTAIAAINSGGQTIHSFFKFPPTFIQKHDIRKQPRLEQILKKLGRLIIDEASMMRSDVLDGIDHSLRINREIYDKPFGGVQVVLIGDLYQLPPVVDRELAKHYEEFYDVPYFFGAKVFKEASFKQFLLTKNYRQRDEKFIALLNKIRHRTIAEADLKELNTRVNPSLAESWVDCVTLVPTNAAASVINQTRLAKLPGDEFMYEAVVEGQFDEASYPTEPCLRLKVGAQILMVKNDSNGRWANGSIGEVIELKKDAIKVRIGHGVYDVLPALWEKFDYLHTRAQSRTIEPVVIGSFEQFPVRLAWSITIHKSQGLTLERVIVDLGDGAFSHGQTYVALSRCKSLDGLVLKRPVNLSDIIFDERVERIFK